jgi:chemotaxis protein methyltransferase CheR
MQPDELAFALSGALSAYGLDLKRFTPALATGYLARFPSPELWGAGKAAADLVSTFAIGETMFMRHPEHFRALEKLVPTLSTVRMGGTLRAFSAGCASGEEAYSLAATLSQAYPGKCEVIGWDMNPEAIARAEAGEYRPWSLRDVDGRATERWLLPSPSGVRVAPHLLQLLRFQVGNLHVDIYPSELDVIFCRNVLLYFSPDAAKKLYMRLSRALKPGGLLFVGHYDPPPPVDSGFVEEVLDGARYFRKLRDAGQLIVGSEPLVQKLASLPPRPLTQPTDPFLVRMERSRQLVNQRRHKEALALLSELESERALQVDLHVLTALTAEDAGDMKLMLDAARKACFLAPDHPGPNYFLSVAFLRNGELRRASLHRRIAAARLRSFDDEKTVLELSEGLTVGQLRRLLGALSR